MSDDARRTACMEPVWLVEATYAPDAAETRVPFRPEHLARAAELKAAGTIVEIGAFTDVSERDHHRPRRVRGGRPGHRPAPTSYVTNGIWVELRARPFNRLV